MARRSTLALFLALLLALAAVPAVQAQSAPTNDNFSSALPIALNAKYTVNDVYLATTESGDTAVCGGPDTNASVWFSFTAPFSGNINISSAGSVAEVSPIYSEPLTIVSIHTGPIGAFASSECSTFSAGAGRLANVAITSGATYFIRIASGYSTMLPGSVYKLRTQVVDSGYYDPGVLDGGFELGSPAWVVKNAANGDGRSDTPGDAFGGSYGFKLMGGPSEATSLQQTVNWPSATLSGYKEHGLILVGAIKATGTAINFKATLKVSYSDGTPTTKASAVLNTELGGWDLFAVLASMESAKLSKVKLQFKNSSTEGTVLLDNVALYYTPELVRSAPLTVPPPAQ